MDRLSRSGWAVSTALRASSASESETGESVESVESVERDHGASRWDRKVPRGTTVDGRWFL